MVLVLWLVRHGETYWNQEGRLQGWEDTELSSLGENQAIQLATHLVQRKPEGFHSIVSSDLTRAMKTAQEVLLKVGRENQVIVPDARLREHNLGIFQGKRARECSRDPLLKSHWKEFLRDPCYRPPEGESSQDKNLRVKEALNSLHETHKRLVEDCGVVDVLVVCHGGVLDAIYQCMDEDPFSVGGDHAANASISIVDATTFGDQTKWSVRSWNDTHHLDVVTTSEAL